jgi:hypothetical protein
MRLGNTGPGAANYLGMQNALNYRERSEYDNGSIHGNMLLERSLQYWDNCPPCIRLAMGSNYPETVANSLDKGSCHYWRCLGNGFRSG